jgi:hypothetical protein
MKRPLAICALATLAILGCAAKWKEPPSWTLRPDGRLRASQRKENFSFKEWSEKYLVPEGATGQREVGIVVTPAGAKKIADELTFRQAEIERLKNALSECR